MKNEKLFEILEVKNTSNKTIPKSKGAMTVVNDINNGHGFRIILSKQLEKDLNLTDSLQLAISEDGKCLKIGVDIDQSKQAYLLRRANKKKANSKLIIYNKPLVEEITRRMDLDFSQCCSITFYGIEYLEERGQLFAIVWRGEANGV